MATSVPKTVYFRPYAYDSSGAMMGAGAVWAARGYERVTDMCDKCKGTGKVTVSYASAENGPTNDPADESGIEFCDCEAGWTEFVIDNIKNEQGNAAEFGWNYTGPDLSEVPTLVQAYMRDESWNEEGAATLGR